VIGLIVMPPVATQSTDWLDDFPGIIRDLRSQPMVQNLDATYHVLDKAAEEINRRLADGAFMSQVFGGVLGAGMAVLSGVVSVFTVLVLTLYFLSSLPTIKRAAYAMVPASRRRGSESSPKRSCVGWGPTPSGRCSSRRSMRAAPTS
jgi:predicted PurR-regulated permease PerM